MGSQLTGFKECPTYCRLREILPILRGKQESDAQKQMVRKAFIPLEMKEPQPQHRAHGNSGAAYLESIPFAIRGNTIWNHPIQLLGPPVKISILNINHVTRIC